MAGDNYINWLCHINGRKTALKRSDLDYNVTSQLDPIPAHSLTSFQNVGTVLCGIFRTETYLFKSDF